MINQNVINGIAWLYSIFDIKLLTFLTATFTIYFGYQKVTKKICVAYRISAGKLYNAHLTKFVISNKRDNVIIIASVNMKIGDKGSVEIIEFEEPLILKGYESKMIEIPKYSNIYNGDKPISIEHSDRLFFSVVTWAGEIIDCDIESSVNSRQPKEMLLKSKVLFKDIVLTNKMGFIFSYILNDKIHDIIFDKHGFITGYTPFGCNSFKNLSEEAFGDFLISKGYHDFYDDYSLIKIQDNLMTEVVLSKALNEMKLSKIRGDKK